MTPDELLELHRSFTASVVRLETLQHYAVPGDDERQRAYREGRPLPPREGKSATVRLIQDAVRAGKAFERIHVVDVPLSDYVRYELDAAYPENVAAGEQVWIVDRAAHPGLENARWDFVLVDAGTPHPAVAWYDYTADGQLTGYRRGSPDDVDGCTATIALARAHALSLADFMTSSFREAQ